MDAYISNEPQLPAVRVGVAEASVSPRAVDSTESESSEEIARPINDPNNDALGVESEAHTKQQDRDKESRFNRPETPSEAEAAGGWNFLLDSAKKYDRKNWEKWADELNNILVFAGLFSAVVTAYTIESYQWLQDDPADQTVQLLTQISSQLASFSVTPAFINATVQPLLSPPPAFRPDDIDVTINLLWFLSLTLSLLSAFFTIAVQQWLRSLPLPSHLDVRGIVYLRQKRHKAFIICQVPHIITLLPVMLQIAVVLFLVGLYHFLRGLSHPITTAVTVVAGLPFVLYAISLFLPLLWPECPFKSPLVPSVVFILRWAFITLLILGIIFVATPSVFVSLAASVVWDYCTKSKEEAKQAEEIIVMKYVDGIFTTLAFLGSLITSATLRLNNFWADREIRHCVRESGDWDISNCRALRWAPNAVPSDQLGRLRPCFLRLRTDHRTECVIEWIALSYNGKLTRTGRSYRAVSEWSPIHVGILQAVDKAFVEQYKTYLLDAVPTEHELSTRDWVKADVDLPPVLILLAQMANTDSVGPQFRPFVVHTLLCLLHRQQLFNLKDPYSYDKARFPAVCLYKCGESGRYKFSVEETKALTFALYRLVGEILSLDKKLRDECRINNVELVLGLAAASLHAIDHQRQTLTEVGNDDSKASLYEALASFDRFVQSERANIQIMGKAALDRTEDPTIITRRAAKSITDTLLVLVNAGYFGPSEVDLVGMLVQNLMETFRNENVFGATFAALEQLRIICPSPRSVPQSPIRVYNDISPTIGPQLPTSSGHLQERDNNTPGTAQGHTVCVYEDPDGTKRSHDNLLLGDKDPEEDNRLDIPLISLPRMNVSGELC